MILLKYKSSPCQMLMSAALMMLMLTIDSVDWEYVVSSGALGNIHVALDILP